MRYFPGGFRDETYIDWERGYKALAHERWLSMLGPSELRRLIEAGEFAEVAARAVAIEGRTNLLFSFEKMAIRDGVRSADGARIFAEALLRMCEGGGDMRQRFERWCAAIGELPRRQTRVLTWPVVTVFPFLAMPKEHIFLKPNVTRRAAKAYGVEFAYASRPNWHTYGSLLAFGAAVRRDQRELGPRDQIDVQSFIWVQGSDEYP